MVSLVNTIYVSVALESSVHTSFLVWLLGGFFLVRFDQVHDIVKFKLVHEGDEHSF